MADLTAKKLSDTQIEITKQAPQPEPVITRYERNFIEAQIKAITAQRDAMIALKEAELKECQDILLECDKLGIVAEVKPEE